MKLPAPHVNRFPASRLVPACLLALGLLGGCAQTQPYQAPKVDVPSDAWHDQNWQPAQPADQALRGDWWTLFGDPVLNALQQRIERDNPTLAVALARYDQAAAFSRQLQAAQAPSVDLGGSVLRNRQSDSRPLRGSNQPDVYGANTVGLSVGYEFDVWGRVRNLVAAGQASAEAAAEDYENVRLSLHATLAQNYLSLRGVDAQLRLVRSKLGIYGKAMALIQNRYDGGIASGIDVARAHTQLSTARATEDSLLARRAVYVNAIAALVGEPAMSFTLPESPQVLTLPSVPVGLPSTLLQRRPDIAAAERRTAAANARIGVARAAYYPTFSLGTLLGYQNTGGPGWLTAPNSFWALGPLAALNLFDGGLRDAQVAQARAALDQAGAEYRAVVLQAFAQVQDELSRLQAFHSQARNDSEAAKSANRAERLADTRYREGAVNFLEVVTAQTAALQAESDLLTLQNQRLQSTLALIRALGGGWSVQQAEWTEGNGKP